MIKKMDLFSCTFVGNFYFFVIKKKTIIFNKKSEWTCDGADG